MSDVSFVLFLEFLGVLNGFLNGCAWPYKS